MVRILVLALGLLYVFGLLEFLFVAIQSPVLEGQIFSGPQGALLLRFLSAVPSFLAAIGTGIATAVVLRHRRAVWLLVALAAAYAASHYFGIQHFQKPDAQQRILEVAQALLIVLLPCLALVVARRVLPWSRT